jgi:hypothetical protein
MATKHDLYRAAVSKCAAAWKQHADNQLHHDENKQRKLTLLKTLVARFPDRAAAQEDPEYQEMAEQLRGLSKALVICSPKALPEFGAACQARRSLLEAMGKVPEPGELNLVVSDIEAAMKKPNPKKLEALADAIAESGVDAEAEIAKAKMGAKE